jgi:hypothetical protein
MVNLEEAISHILNDLLFLKSQTGFSKMIDGNMLISYMTDDL